MKWFLDGLLRMFKRKSVTYSYDVPFNVYLIDENGIKTVIQTSYIRCDVEESYVR